jgi:hypothetical protein
MAKKKSWHEKLYNSEGLPKVVEITEKMSSRWGTGTLVIPALRECPFILRGLQDYRFCWICLILSSMMLATSSFFIRG